MGNREVVHTVLGTRAAPQDSSTNPQAVIQGGSTVQPTHLFTTALGLTAPWEVTDVRFDPEAGRIDLDVAFAKGSRFACPACGVQGQPVHDTRERSWQHLSFFKSRAYLHAHLPRVRCEACGKTTQVEAAVGARTQWLHGADGGAGGHAVPGHAGGDRGSAPGCGR